MVGSDRSDVFARRESNVRFYGRHFPVTFSSANGAWLETREGDRYLDLLSAAGSLNYGHNNPEIMAEVLDYIASGGVVQSLDMQTEAKAAFLEAFEAHVLLPRGLDYKVQFPNASGANAVEAAAKLARKATGRRTLAAFTNGFHGMSLGALALSTNPTARAGAGAPLPNVVFWPYEGSLGPAVDTVDQIDAQLAAVCLEDRPAAAILEVVQGEGGLSAASDAWLRRLAATCDRHGVLLIVDDIQAGCGRTGDFFSFERAGIIPDIVVLSKSLSGFGTPFSLVLLQPRLDIWKPGEHNGTFRGNNLAFVGARAAIELYWRDGGFSKAIGARSALTFEALSDMASHAPDRLRVKGRGLMLGLEFAETNLASRCSLELFRQGIIAETCGRYDQTLKLLPPLTIELRDLQTALGKLEAIVGVLCLRGETVAG